MDPRQLMSFWRSQKGRASFRVVAFGSSNTEIGWHSDGRHGWPCWLSCILRASVGQHVQTMNAGIGGNTAADLLGRIQGDVLDARPHMVVVTIGGNDYFQKHPLATFEANLRKIESILTSAGAAVVFQTYYAMLPEAGEGISDYMNIVRKVARDTGSGLIDQYSWFLPWRDSDLATYRTIMRDGAHVKPIGNALMGTLAGRVLGLWDPAMPPDMPIYDHIPALEKFGAPPRNITLQ